MKKQEIEKLRTPQVVILFLISIVTCLGLLYFMYDILHTAYNHYFNNNKLLEDKYIIRMQENAMFLDDHKSFEECARFYKFKEKNSYLEVKCNKWIIGYRQQLINTNNIPRDIKIEDLKSPELWRRVIPSN